LITSTSYGPAGELLSMGGTGWGSETRSYNSMLQLTQLVSGSSVNVVYDYSPTQNNGKITSQRDYVSGEQVNYAYDSLNRLMAAVTADNSVINGQPLT